MAWLARACAKKSSAREDFERGRKSEGGGRGGMKQMRTIEIARGREEKSEGDSERKTALVIANCQDDEKLRGREEDGIGTGTKSRGTTEPGRFYKHEKDGPSDSEIHLSQRDQQRVENS